MAEKDDPSSRTSTRTESVTPARTPIEPLQDPVAALQELIERERARLMKASDTLHCVLAAMEEENGGFRGPYYPGVIEVARELVNHTLDQLDSVRLRPLIRALKGDQSVKEPHPTYADCRSLRH